MNLDHRTQALIAVGASVAANCQPCLESAAAQAVQAGADGQQLADAIDLGKRVRWCAGGKIDKFALNLIAGIAPANETGAECQSCA